MSAEQLDLIEQRISRLEQLTAAEQQLRSRVAQLEALHDELESVVQVLHQDITDRLGVYVTGGKYAVDDPLQTSVKRLSARSVRAAYPRRRAEVRALPPSIPADAPREVIDVHDELIAQIEALTAKCAPGRELTPAEMVRRDYLRRQVDQIRAQSYARRGLSQQTLRKA